MSEYYRHYKGSMYQIVARAVPVWAPEQGYSVVVYKNVATGDVWARTADEFFGYVGVDGVKVKRFAHSNSDHCREMPALSGVKMNILGEK